MRSLLGCSGFLKPGGATTSGREVNKQ